MNQKRNFTVSLLGLLTAGLLSGCNSTGLGNLSASLTSDISSLSPLAASDLDKSLLSGAVAEVLALRIKAGQDKTLGGDEIAALSSASIRISDPDGKDTAFLVLTGPEVKGDFWTALAGLDEKVARSNGTYNSLVGTQPMMAGVQWLELGVAGLKKARRNLDQVGGPAALERLVVVNHVSLAAKLKNGKLINLQDLREISPEDVTAFRQQEAKSLLNLGRGAELKTLDAEWSLTQQALENLNKSGANIPVGLSAAEFNAMGAPVDSRLDYRKFSTLLKTTTTTVADISGQALLTGQSEQGSSSCWWIFCAYQYDSSLPEYIIGDYSGGFAQSRADYEVVPATESDTYRALEFNAVTSGGVISDTTLGCGASSLIALMDYHWRRSGVRWYNMDTPQAAGRSARPIYTKNDSTRYRPYNNPTTNPWTEATNPVMLMGKKNLNDRSLAMDLVGTRASGGIGTVVTSQMNGGVYNFLQQQQAGGYLGQTGQSFTARMNYADVVNLSSGTTAGIIRDVMGNYNYPFIVMYPTGGLAGHVSLATRYMVYYPSNGGGVQVYTRDVDFPDVLRSLHNALSHGVFGYR